MEIFKLALITVMAILVAANGYAINDVHPYDVEKYCPFCRGKVKQKPFTRHPDLRSE